MQLRQKILDFLYKQVEDNKIPHIRKGMPEDFEKFIVSLFEDVQVTTAADRMMAKKAALEGSEEKSNA